MFADAWTTLPEVITALTGLAVVILTYLTRREVKTMAPKVSAIDNAVNGQPDGAPTLVSKVAGIEVEQGRVAAELAVTRQPKSWADVADSMTRTRRL